MLKLADQVQKKAVKSKEGHYTKEAAIEERHLQINAAWVATKSFFRLQFDERYSLRTWFLYIENKDLFAHALSKAALAKAPKATAPLQRAPLLSDGSWHGNQDKVKA